MAAARGSSPKTKGAIISAAKKTLSAGLVPPKVVKRGSGSKMSISKTAIAAASVPAKKNVQVKLIGPPRAALRPWGLPGVFRDHMGRHVDEDGRLLGIEYLDTLEDELAEKVINCKVDSPAKYLLFISLYRGFDMEIRQAAAVQAAPYFDKKQPLLQQTQELPAGGALDAEALAKLSKAEREGLLGTLQKLGVKL